MCRMKKFRPTSVVTAIALSVCVAAVGLGISAAREMPLRISAGKHELRMAITGTGSPTVILETIGPANLENWNRIQRRIARFATVVSYDHARYWASEPGPKPRDATRIARELHTALAHAKLPPPYVLVGYSFGGPYIRVFAGWYPDEVAGMVFVDPTQESFMAMLNVQFPELNVVSEADRLAQDEWGMQWPSMIQARDARLPEVPITLITGAKSHDVLSRKLLPLWQAEHANWLAQFPGAKHVVTTNSGHGVVFTEPELIVGAVREVVGRVRAKETP
jgi:pimeloyl-ACP methyl ester carboxylesterase